MKHLIFEKNCWMWGSTKPTGFRASGSVFFAPASNFVHRTSNQCWSLSVSFFSLLKENCTGKCWRCDQRSQLNSTFLNIKFSFLIAFEYWITVIADYFCLAFLSIIWALSQTVKLFLKMMAFCKDWVLALHYYLSKRSWGETLKSTQLNLENVTHENKIWNLKRREETPISSATVKLYTDMYRNYHVTLNKF